MILHFLDDLKADKGMGTTLHVHPTSSQHCLYCHPICLHLFTTLQHMETIMREFGRGMYVLNLNQCLKVEDSYFPLSCDAVKVSFQIKKGAFLIYLILFSFPSGAGNSWCYLWSNSLPYPVLYTHTYRQCKHTWSQYFMVGVTECSGFSSRVPRPRNTNNSRV